jgi:hypothetical protein
MQPSVTRRLGRVASLHLDSPRHLYHRRLARKGRVSYHFLGWADLAARSWVASDTASAPASYLVTASVQFLRISVASMATLIFGADYTHISVAKIARSY